MPTISQLAVRLTLNSASFTTGVARVITEVADLGAAGAGAVTGLRALGDEAGHTETRLAGLTNSAKSAVTQLLGVASATAGIGLGVKLAADFEQAEVAFTTMLGSAEKARAMMADISDFAASTPFEIPGLVTSAKSLIAFGVAQQQIIPTLRVLGDLSAGLNIPLNELAELYGKAKVQGRLYMQDINQLTGRGIPVIQEFAKQFGVTEGEVRKLVEQGKIGFPHLQRALVSLTSAGGAFAGGMKAQSQTIAGLFSTVQDSINTLLRAFGEAFGKAIGLGDIMRSVTASAEMLVPAARMAGAALGTMFRWVGSLGKAILPVIIAMKAFAFTLGVGFSILKMLIAIQISRWIMSWLGIRAAAMAYHAALVIVRLGYMAATFAAVVFHAMTGPKGWIILAAGAVAAAAAITAVKKAYDSVAEAMKKAKADAAADFENLIPDSPVDDRAAAGRAAVTAYKAQLTDLRTAIEDIDREIAGAHLPDGARQRDLEMRQLVAKLRAENMANSGGTNFGLSAEQAALVSIIRQRKEQLEIIEAQRNITEELADMERQAAQAEMTKGQRMLDDLKRIGATQAQIDAARAAANKIDEIDRQKKLATEQARAAAEQKRAGEEAARMVEQLSSLDKYKKQVADIERLRKVGALGAKDAQRALDAAGAEFLRDLSSGAGRALESPTALLKGTAEADLAADRQKTQFERLTEIQRQALSEQKAARAIAQRQLDAMKDDPAVAAIP